MSEPPTSMLAKRSTFAPRNAPFALMLLVLGAYLLTMSGHIYSPDEQTMVALSRSLVEDQSWAVTPQPDLFLKPGVNGNRYSEKGPGQSLAAVPWTAAGLLAGKILPADQAEFALQLVMATYNALIGAGIAALFAALGLALGYSRRVSLLLAGSLAFSTLLWPQSRTFFAEPLVTLCLGASFYLLVVAHRTAWGPPALPRREMARLALSGLLFAAAIFVKVQYLPVLLAFLVYLIWEARHRGFTLRGLGLRAGQGVSNKRVELRFLIPAGWWFVGFAVGLLPFFLYNWTSFGGPLTTGYGEGLRDFRTPLYEGAFGLLLSPGKGMLWYSLPLLLSVWGFSRFARRHSAEAAFVAVLCTAMVVVFGMYATWHGDGAWGPRYLLPLLPFALLPALTAMRHVSPPRRAPARLAVTLVIALGLLVNLGAVFVNFDIYLNVGYDGRTRYFIPDASPILGHASLLALQMRTSMLRFAPQSHTVFLDSGLSYTEGNKAAGKVLPRWTTGRAELDVWPDLRSGPVTMTLRLSDHRPSELPRARAAIIVDGKSGVAVASPVKDQPVSTDYSFAVSERPAHVVVESDTWNPSKLREGERNEELGLMLDSISVVEGGQQSHYEVVEAFAAPPYYPNPLWYYDLRTTFAADWWPVYMVEGKMGRKLMLGLGVPIVILALGCIMVGWRGLRRAS